MTQGGKNILIALGKAGLYFLLYCLTRFLLGFMMSTVISAQVMIRCEGKMDTAALAERLAQALPDCSWFVMLSTGVLTTVILLVFFKVRKKLFLKEAVINRVHVRALLYPALLGISFFLFVFLFMRVLRISHDVPSRSFQALGIHFGASSVAVFFSATLVAPVLDEVLYRGLILSRLSRVMPPVVSAVISSGLFAAAHIGLVPLTATFTLGLLLCYVCTHFRSVLASYTVHVMFNLTAFIISVSAPLNLSIPLTAILLVLCSGASAALLIAVGKTKTQYTRVLGILPQPTDESDEIAQ
jgi:uncharacterized protein